MKLSLIKKLNTSHNSIFYSFINYNNEIIGFGRNYYGNERLIKKVTLDENFDIIEDNIRFKGEDPRCFEFKNKLYILDNYCNDMYLINYENKNYIKINISGKNISFINHNHNDTLYFIHFIKPFHLYTFDIETNIITKIDVDDDNNTYNYEYRGGTPGYRLNENEYYGFGHRTYEDNNVIKHDIFKWIVYFEDNKLPRILHFNIEQPIHSKNICDPTCVVTIKNKNYLVTAESENIWFCEQEYVTNLYEIIDEKSYSIIKYNNHRKEQNFQVLSTTTDIEYAKKLAFNYAKMDIPQDNDSLYKITTNIKEHNLCSLNKTIVEYMIISVENYKKGFKLLYCLSNVFAVIELQNNPFPKMIPKIDEKLICNSYSYFEDDNDE